jgi:hypothetical protein
MQEDPSDLNQMTTMSGSWGITMNPAEKTSEMVAEAKRMVGRGWGVFFRSL